MKLFTCLLISVISFQLAYAAAPSTKIEAEYLSKCTSEDDLFNIETLGNPGNLSDAQRLSIYLYTMHMFDSINPKLWQGEALGSCEELFVQVLDSALEALPNYKGTVYRGTTKKYISLVENQNYPTKMLGYTSTSVSRESSEEFLVDRREIIEVISGKDISAYSGAHAGGIDEKEILLPRNSLLFVKSIEEKMEEIMFFDYDTYEDKTESRLIQTVYAKQVQ